MFSTHLLQKKDENKPYNITINGVVSDQVTGEPVAGATVSLGHQYGCFREEGLWRPKQSTSTGPDGRYELITSAEHLTGLESLGSIDESTIALIASKSGYIGSDRPVTS